MSKYQAVVFDFDGTLVDSGPGIVMTLKRMLKELGRPPAEEAVLCACVGPPIAKYFPEVFGFEGEELVEAIALYRRLFDEHALPLLRAYPGAAELLRDVRRAGMLTCVATCKLQRTCEEQAAMLGLAPYLDAISGAQPEKNLLEKEDMLGVLIAEHGVDPARSVMVGDRLFDMIGAQCVHMPAIGVLYGCGSREELAAYSPLALAESVEALRETLLS